ncbi:MAG: hypothetical protein A2286_01045 [Gammaproteobacteria bacterium RIFOXYA12_FULL_61_12]|nr:MAG: hypothetical protein A2514_13230 [Gammaproteobacteria bacterium RIFOXYD12_FULL_61_37]OGT92687.1 MAG: hypothetical protein A2286_01045 [Gammaproteobacteria bacterium RIFOXYA12_FULL_61_12]
MALQDAVPLLILSACVGVGGFYYFFRNSFRARLIEDMPTSKVRSAAQGYIELAGRALLMDGEPIRSLLTGTTCCWWRYRIERRGSKNQWNLVESGVSDSPFLLEDDTGRCLIDPEGADVTPFVKNVWYGSSRVPGPSRRGGGLSFGIGIGIGLGSYRYTEEFIFPGNPLYAIGLFRSLGEMDHQEGRGEIMRNLLRQWKEDRPALLARFDKDGSGDIDMGEWEAARKTAAALAEKEYREIQANQVPHMLGKPHNKGQPYILATKEETELKDKLRLWSYLALFLGMAGSGLALFLFLGRFAG